MTETATVTASGIKCDAEGCDYKDMSVQPEDYVDWVNRPCPDCGANLLTEADFELVGIILEMTGVINDMFPPGSFPDEPRAKVEIKFDGSGIPKVGEMNFEEREDDD